MKYLLSAVLLLVACAVAPPPPPEVPVAEPVDVLDHALDATIALVDKTSQRTYCSGVAFEAVVLTAAHCVDDAAELEEMVLVGFRDDYDWSSDEFSNLYQYSVLHTDHEDMAILIPQSGHVPPATAELSHDGTWPGREAVAVGHAWGRLTWTFTHGYVVAEHPASGLLDRRWLQLSINGSPGFSGGPIYNKYGEIMGLTSFGAYGENYLTGAVSLPVIRDALAKTRQGPSM